MTNIPKPPTALVAGGAGFIGSHLCDRLISEGYRVICLDNLYTGSMDNIAHLMTYPRFTFVRHDVTRPYEVSGLSIVFNLACPASPVHYQKDAVYTAKTAFLGTLNMLELARDNDCVMLQASTSEVYGNLDNGITNEKVLLDYLVGADPFNDSSCIKCKLLPVCSGGCPHARLQAEKNGLKHAVCPPIKNNLKSFLILHKKEKGSSL